MPRDPFQELAQLAAGLGVSSGDLPSELLDGPSPDDILTPEVLARLEERLDRLRPDEISALDELRPLSRYSQLHD